MSINEIAHLHARTAIYKRSVSTAITIIDRAIDIGILPYVGFSTGKDSTVVADLVCRRYHDVPLLYGDEEWLLPESEAYLDRMVSNIGSRLHRIKAADWHAEWFQTWQNCPDAIHSSNASGVYAARQGWGLAFLGLRQEESSARRVYLRTHGPLHLSKTDGSWYCNPIHNWTWRDVWAYIVSNDLDYNRAYDRLEEIGVEPERQRIGPLAVERVLGYGQIAILKRGWPDLYNRFVAAHPEAAGYT